MHKHMLKCVCYVEKTAFCVLYSVPGTELSVLHTLPNSNFIILMCGGFIIISVLNMI